VSSSMSLVVLLSRASSVWSRASVRGSDQTTSDGSMRATFFLDGIVRLFY
jgi:hypothetical protein